MHFFTWVLPVLGCTLIITCSTLMRPLREFWRGRVDKIYELLCCPMCTGFWVGAMVSTMGFSFVGTHVSVLSRFGAGFADACAAAYVCWASHVVLCKLGQGRYLSSRPDLKAAEGWTLYEKGLLTQEEWKSLGEILENPRRAPQWLIDAVRKKTAA